MATVIELRQERAGLVKQARELVDAADKEKRALSAEEETQYNKIMADVDAKKAEIDRREKLEAVELEMAGDPEAGRSLNPDDDKETRILLPRERKEYRAAFNSYLRGGAQELKAEEMRALQADNDTLGGYLLAPLQMVTDLIKAIDDSVHIRRFATVHSIAGASDGLGAPSLDADPADSDWTTELAIGSEDSDMDFGKRELHPHPLAKLLKVSRKLIRKVPSAEGLVRDRLAYKLGITQEKAYLTGSGAGRPLGLFTASDNGIPTSRDIATDNTATAMTADGLINALYGLKEGYQRNARWMFHRDGVKMIRKLKDGEGQYLWAPGISLGQPDTILAKPFLMSEYVPNTFTTGKYVGIVGDFSYYWIADDLNMEIQRLIELYAATNQIGFVCRYSGDGMPVLGEAFARVTLGS